ncbi:MAG: ABC transporter permease [Promethearchaeota archaeon]|nr:MAG: ABC transporter permease [Candidatus Lokiarchaeota archaeon]
MYETKLSEDLKNQDYKKTNSLKMVLSWIIHNLRFLFIPGYRLDELEEKQTQYDLKFGVKHKLHRYKRLLFIYSISAILFLVTLATFQHWISPYTYIESSLYDHLIGQILVTLEGYFPPSSAHPLGQTFMGYDIWARIIFGTAPVLIFAVTSTIISILIGIVIGAVSGYYGGWLDVLFMRIMDIILSFPGVVFAIIFITILGGDFLYLILIYSIIGIPYFARIIRTNVIKEKELPYIVAGKVSGAKNKRLLFRHILPNCTQPLIVAISYNIGRNILSITVLGFLRLGGIAWIEWGYDIALSVDMFISAPWAAFYPSLMILIAVSGFLLLGDCLNDINLLRQEII